MKDAIQRVEPDSAAAVDTCEEILTAKEVAQDIEASRSWVYAHADELGSYRVGRRLWFRWQCTAEGTGANNPSEHKDSRSANENESHQRRDAAASLPPRPGLPFPFDNHRAESIPLALPPLTHFPLATSRFPLQSLVPWSQPDVEYLQERQRAKRGKPNVPPALHIVSGRGIQHILAPSLESFAETPRQ